MCSAPSVYHHSRPASSSIDWTDQSTSHSAASSANHRPGQRTPPVETPMQNPEWIHICKDGWDSVRPVVGHEEDRAQGPMDRKVFTIQRVHDEYKAKTDQACEPCRRRKSKCDGGAVCSRCINRGIQCVYGQPRKQPSGRRPSRTVYPSKTTPGSRSVRGSTEDGPKASRSTKLARPSTRTPVMTFKPLGTTHDSPTAGWTPAASPLLQSSFPRSLSTSAASSSSSLSTMPASRVHRPAVPQLQLEMNQMSMVPAAPASAGMVPMCNHIKHPAEQLVRRNSMGNWVPSTTFEMGSSGMYVPTRHGLSQALWTTAHRHEASNPVIRSEPIDQNLALKGWRPAGPNRSNSSPTVNPHGLVSHQRSMSTLSSTPSSLSAWSGEPQSDQSSSEHSNHSTDRSPMSSVSNEATPNEPAVARLVTDYQAMGMWTVPHYDYHQTSYHPIGYSYVYTYPYAECSHHVAYDLVDGRATTRLEGHDHDDNSSGNTLGLGSGDASALPSSFIPMSNMTSALELPIEQRDGPPGLLFWGDP